MTVDQGQRTDGRITPRRVAMLAACLLGLGFVVGYGAGAGVRRAGAPPARSPSPADGPDAPVIKALRVSPDGQRVAFTGVYDNSRQAALWVFDLGSGAVRQRLSPRGWQDYVTQWSQDGRGLIFEREKIPRPVEESSAGIYREAVPPVLSAKVTPASPEAQLLTRGVAPQGERVTGGFLAPNGELAIKTRREPKALYLLQQGQAVPIDRAATSYLQSRAVRENGLVAFYTVRDEPQSPGDFALFRVAGGKSRRLGEPFGPVTWAYLAENARHLILCRESDDEKFWQWMLYGVSPQGLKPRGEARVPSDAIAVYWSPDGKMVLGAGGKSLWAVDVPSLRTRRIGARQDWNSDDAAWLPGSKAVVVAASGRLWHVETANGKSRVLWKFPPQFWN